MMNKEKRKQGERSGRAFLNKDGRIRTGWLLTFTLILFYGIRLGVRLSLNGAFSALFGAWGIDASNAYRAPAWARTVYSWHGSIITAIVGLFMLAVALGLRKLWLKDRVFMGKLSRGGALFLIGAAFSVASAALFLLLDSMRLEWRLSQPCFSVSQPVVLLVMLLSAVSEEFFNKALLLDGLRPRWGKMAAVLAASAVFFLDSAGYAGNAACAVNVLILGLLCCCLYMKWGVWASAALRCGISYGASVLMGFGNGSAETVYKVYHVSDAWLTGGDGGPVYGLWMTVILLAGLIWLNRKSLAGLTDKLALKTKR